MMKRITLLLAITAIASAGIFFGISYFTAPEPFDPDKYLDQEFRSFSNELQAARDLYAQGKLAKAEQALSNIIDKYRHSPSVAHSILEPHFDLARIYKDKGKIAGAQEEYEYIVENATDPTILLRARLELGALRAAADDPALLEKLYMDFKDAPEAGGKVAAKYAEILIEKEQFAKAADILCRALTSPAAASGINRDRLEKLLTTAMDAKAGQAKNPLEAAGIYLEQAQKFPQMQTKCWEWLQHAGLLFQQENEFAAARNAFNRIIRDYPGESDSQANAGYALLEELDEAERAAATPLTEGGIEARLQADEPLEIVRQDIRQNTVWQPGKTYAIIGEVAVRKGSTLTIRPGVRIEFALHASLMIHGRLEAAGTAEQPLVFTSAADEPSFFDWEGVRFSECTAGSIVNAKIEYARKGIVCEDIARDEPDQAAAIELENITVIQCGFTAFESRYAAPRLTNVQVTDNDGYGMIFFRSFGSVTGGSVSNSGRVGVSIRKESYPAFAGTVIDGSGETGVECFDGSNATFTNIVVANSGRYGIHSVYSSPTVSNSEIRDNRRAGLFWSDGSKGTLTELEIRENSGGVYCTIASAPVIKECRFIENASFGIKCETSNPEIIGNDFRQQYAAGIVILDICRPVVRGNTFGAEGTAVRHEGEYQLDLTENKWPEDTAVTELIEVPDGADMQKLIRLIPQQ